MADLPRYKSESAGGPAQLQEFGIVRGGERLVEQKFASANDPLAIGHKLNQSAAQDAIFEGQKAGESVELTRSYNPLTGTQTLDRPLIEDGSSYFTKSRNDALIKNYINATKVDANKYFGQLAVTHQYDQEGFNKGYEQYTKAVLERTPTAQKQDIKTALAEQATEYQRKISQNVFLRGEKQHLSEALSAIELQRTEMMGTFKGITSLDQLGQAQKKFDEFAAASRNLTKLFPSLDPHEIEKQIRAAHTSGVALVAMNQFQDMYKKHGAKATLDALEATRDQWLKNPELGVNYTDASGVSAANVIYDMIHKHVLSKHAEDTMAYEDGQRAKTTFFNSFMASSIRDIHSTSDPNVINSKLLALGDLVEKGRVDYSHLLEAQRTLQSVVSPNPQVAIEQMKRLGMSAVGLPKEYADNSAFLKAGFDDIFVRMQKGELTNKDAMAATHALASHAASKFFLGMEDQRKTEAWVGGSPESGAYSHVKTIWDRTNVPEDKRAITMAVVGGVRGMGKDEAKDFTSYINGMLIKTGPADTEKLLGQLDMMYKALDLGNDGTTTNARSAMAKANRTALGDAGAIELLEFAHNTVRAMPPADGADAKTMNARNTAIASAQTGFAQMAAERGMSTDELWKQRSLAMGTQEDPGDPAGIARGSRLRSKTVQETVDVLAKKLDSNPSFSFLSKNLPGPFLGRVKLDTGFDYNNFKTSDGRVIDLPQWMQDMVSGAPERVKSIIDSIGAAAQMPELTRDATGLLFGRVTYRTLPIGRDVGVQDAIGRTLDGYVRQGYSTEQAKQATTSILSKNISVDPFYTKAEKVGDSWDVVALPTQYAFNQHTQSDPHLSMAQAATYFQEAKAAGKIVNPKSDTQNMAQLVQMGLVRMHYEGHMGDRAMYRMEYQDQNGRYQTVYDTVNGVVQPKLYPRIERADMDALTKEANVKAAEQLKSLGYAGKTGVDTAIAQAALTTFHRAAIGIERNWKTTSPAVDAQQKYEGDLDTRMTRFMLEALQGMGVEPNSAKPVPGNH